MGRIGRFLAWSWRRWGDYQSLCDLLALLGWKSYATAVGGGVITMIIRYVSGPWTLDGMFLLFFFAAIFVLVASVIIQNEYRKYLDRRRASHLLAVPARMGTAQPTGAAGKIVDLRRSTETPTDRPVRGHQA